MDKDILPKLSAIALNSIFGYDPKFSHRIIDALGSAEAVFGLSDEEKRHLFGPFCKYLPLITDESLEAAGRQYDALKADGVRILSIYDKEYPALLRECGDAPMVLYVRSSDEPGSIFNSRPAISIVGTRDISPYGKEWCQRIVRVLSEAPSHPAIVSGLAIGVDITAHMAALECGLPTVAVLPVGIDSIYPARHRRAAEMIASAPGSAVVTDYPPGTGAVAFNFLRRNRIIAGMGQATVLVESKIKGGGMMTARLASGYSRDVFALPGRIDDTRSQGCNTLIREGLAEAISSLDSLPSALGLGRYSFKKATDLESAVRARYSSAYPAQYTGDLVRIALTIKESRGISIDGICEQLGMDYRVVSVMTGILENDRFIFTDLLQRCTINAKIY